MSQILTRRRSRQLNCSSDVTSGVGSVCETSVKVGEGNGSDLFISDDDDVVDRDYVQPAHMSSSDDESLPTRKEQRKKHKAMSLLQPCVSRLSDPELSDGTGRTPARGSRVFAVTRIALESDSSYHTQVKKQRKSYNSKDKKDFRWSLELLHTAVCEHRWEDAFSLLPCVITHTVPHLPLEFLWRMTDVITRNIPSLSIEDRKKFRSILHGMKLRTSMFLDILSQDLAEATDKDVDELLQMIEDIQNQRLPPAMGITIKTSKRFKALSDGYVGLVHYYCWKSSLLNAMSSSQPLDDDSWSVSFSESQGTTNTSKKEIVRKAHSFLKKALSGLSEPCDWFMLQYLELEQELNGQESAINALERYKSDPRRAPAHHLAYHFYKNLVSGSVVEQLIELECISKACSDDPLVLEQVNLYLHSLDHGGPTLERAMMWMRSAESDSGQESNDDCLPGQINTSCTLRKTGKVEVLMRCLMLLVGMLDYPCHTWNLKPWQKLTQVLTKFYQAWVKCWFCLACKKTRKRMHRLAQTVVPLWKHFVWKEPPATLSLEQAKVLFHHVFAAFIFNYSDEYVSLSMSALVKNGHLLLKKELMSLMKFPGAFQRHFSLLAKEHRKRVEGISLRSLSQTACQNKKAIQQNQKRTQDTSEAATIISSHDLNQETHREGPRDSGSECEDEVLQLTPFKDSVSCNILNQETGLSPRFLRNIFDTSLEGNFITSTQTKDEKCRDQKKLVEDPELNGTYITYQETDKENNKCTSASAKINDDHSSHSKIGNCKRFPNITSTRKDFGDHNDKVNGKQDSIENMKYSKSTSIKAKSKKEKLPQSEESVPQSPAVCMRTRLSTNAFYQSYDKGNKTVVDADQNCLPEEDTGTVSCLTHKLGSDRSVSDNRQCVDCQKETSHEVQGTEHGLLQLEGQKEHGSCDEAESTCLKNPEKKRLLFDKTLSTNTKVTRHDVNVTLETSVGNTEDKNECSVSSSSSAEDVPDTRTSCHSSELKSDKPENSTSGVDKKQRNGKKDKTERSKSQKVKHKLKNLINNTEEKKKQTPSTEEKENITPEHSIKSVENKYQDPNASLVKGTIADGDSPRPPKWTRSENDMMYRTIVRETETQSHDEASDDTSQTVPETQSHDEASDDVLQTVSKTQSQLITSVNLSTEDRYTDKTQREENEATHRKQNEPVQEEENDKIRGKQNQEVQEKTKSKEQHCDETDVGKQTQSAQGERKSEEQVLNSTGQRKQKGVSSNSLEIDASRVCNQEYSQSSIDTLTAGQRERECTSSPEEPVPSSPCGQGFFVTQESKSGEPLLSPDGKESGSQKPGHEDLNIDELKELDLVDLDHYLLREQKEQYYCESIKDEENSLEVHSWHSDKTPGGLLESVSVAQGHKESCRPTACVTEEEASVKDEEGCDSITEVQDFEKCSGSNHKSPQKLLEKSVPKEDSEGSKALPKKSWPSKSKLQTPSTKHPIMPWCMLHVEDLPTPSMLDIVKHSDTSTPNTRGKQRQGRSGMCSSVTGTLKDTRITRRRSCVPHYLASWLEGLPLPDTDNSTPNGKSKDSDAHEARLKIPDAVLSSTSPKKKTLRESKNSLINSGMENSDSMLSDASTIKTENSSKKRKKNILACTDEGMTDLKGLEDSISQCGKDGEASAEPATQTSVPTAEEFVTINNKQECETRNDMCVSVTDGMDDLSILRDAEVSLEASPEKNTSSLIETDNNGLENDGEQCVEQDTQSGTNTDRLKGLPSNYEDQVDGLEISENVLKDNNHHSVGEDFQCATQADWLKDLPLINVSEVTALVTSPDRNDTSKTNEQCSRKRKSSLRVLEMDWIKDLPISNENRQSNTETSLERDISSAPKAKDPTQATTKQNKKRKSERQKIKWSFNLPLDIKNKRRKSIMKWTEDLPLDIDGRRQESVMKWLEDLPLDIENKRRESVMKWTEDLPLDIEKTPACLQKSLHEHNTSRVDKTALSTNQCVDEENNEEEETHGTSSHSINKIDQESEVPSRRLTRAYWNSAIDSETDIIGERQKSDSIKEGGSVQEVNKSSDESPRNNKVTDSNPNRTLEESVKDGDCEKGNRDLKEERDKRNTNQEESERGSRGGNQRSNGHKECEGETTYYDANEDMTDGLKRKTGKTKQKECENNKDDSHKLSESIGHEESDGETSCCGVGDMEDGNKGKRKKTKQKGYEKSKDNRHEHSGNIGHEECAGETSYYGASDMEAESNENRESKTKTSLERDITPIPEAKDPTQTTTKQNKKRKKQEMKWTEDLPLDIENKRRESIMKRTDLPLDIKNKRRKSIMKWTEDLPLDIEDKRQESVMKWTEDLPLDIENKRRESVMKWTEDLPLDIEKTPACLQKSLHEHNTSRVDKTALSTNQCVDEENNEDKSVTSPPCVNDLTDNSKQEEETHGTSSHSINKIDQESEVPSRRLTRAYWNSAIDSKTDIIGERQKSGNKKEGGSVQEVNKKSSDESPSKVTDSNPNRTLEESIRDGDCEKGNRDLKEERDKRNTNQEESERGSRGGNQRSNGHKECEGETTYYDANEDMTDGLKRKTGKTKQKECENNKDDSHKLSESIGHEESDGETSCCGVGDMEDGNKGKRKKTKQKGYEKSKDNRHEHSGNIGHEECAGETSYYGASDMEAESNENRESKTKTSLERDITPIPEAKDPTQTTTKQNKKRKKQEMKWTEDLPLDIENIRHEECEGYSSYYDVSDMENGRKRKKRKTKQKEYGKDKDNEENAGNMGHECEGEPSYYGASDMDNGSERKKKWTKQKEYERETMDNNQETSGNIRHEVYGEERYFTVSEENAEFKASQHEKDSPYNVETIWHSSSNLTVTTSKRKRTTPNKRALSQYSSRPSKRQKVESSRLSSECSTPSDQNFSITVCNQIESLSNIRITLCRSPGSDGTASMDRGIKVQVQFSDKHSVTGGGELCTPVTGQDGSVDLRQSVKSPRVCTPHKSQPGARKRKLFEDDSS